MQTSWFTETLRSDLEAVGAMGSDKAMKVADRMIAVALPLAKARMLEAMSMALTELSAAVGIERIDLRVSGDEVTFVPAEQHATPAPDLDLSGEQARFSLRLPDDLKSLVEAKAAAEGVSSNTWIVHALRAAVTQGTNRPSPRTGRRLSGFGHA